MFPNAPLEFVACEIRTPTTPRLIRDETFEAMSDAFHDTFPIPDEEQIPIISVLGGRDDAITTEKRFRFYNVERRTSVVVSRNAVTVESTDYSEFYRFRDTVLAVVETIGELVRIIGVERVGLRYIDEVRVPEPIESAADWATWISDDILAPVLVPLEGFEPTEFQTVLHRAGPLGQVIARYGALNGPGVVGDSPLRRRSPREPGPFFLIDTDSFRQMPAEQMIKFSKTSVGRALDDLHEPIDGVFHAAITNRSRSHFRGEA